MGSQLRNAVVLDFDGVVTDKRFSDFYTRIRLNHNTKCCSANPEVTEERFHKLGLLAPEEIHSMKGKIKKIRRLLNLQEKYDMMFYIDDETEYLDYAWLFGIKTYHWNGRQIKEYTRKTK